MAGALQDYLVPLKAIHELWAAGKMSHQAARLSLVTCRAMGADRVYKYVDWIEERETSYNITDTADALKLKLEATLGTFRSHHVIDEWLRQYSEEQVDKTLRFKPLLLQGESQTGKTRKGLSLFGSSRTLVVNCQGLGKNLPSLRSFDHQRHSCILFDEANSRQVLENKVVFQAGVDPVSLGQSACNAFAYTVWLRAVPMILCSNDFQMEDRSDAKMPAEDVEWLQSNIMEAKLPRGQPWFFGKAGGEPPEVDMPEWDSDDAFPSCDTQSTASSLL